MCNQTAALIARTLEENLISTIMISLLKEVTEKVRPPRVLEVPFGFGHPLGLPNDPTTQLEVLEACLKLLEEAKEPETWRQFQESRKPRKQEFGL